MKTKFGATNNLLLIAVTGASTFILGIVIICAVAYFSARNYGNNMEIQMLNLRENNKNIYTEGVQKVFEIAPVSGKYSDGFSKIIKQDVEGYHGQTGARATIGFLREHNSVPDTVTYFKIRQIIESTRDEFESNQINLIVVKRTYELSLTSKWEGMWLHLAGYPRIKLEEFQPIHVKEKTK